MPRAALGMMKMSLGLGRDRVQWRVRRGWEGGRTSMACLNPLNSLARTSIRTRNCRPRRSEEHVEQNVLLLDAPQPLASICEEVRHGHEVCQRSRTGRA